jgi:hypothetical protein
LTFLKPLNITLTTLKLRPPPWLLLMPYKLVIISKSTQAT